MCAKQCLYSVRCLAKLEDLLIILNAIIYSCNRVA